MTPTTPDRPQHGAHLVGEDRVCFQLWAPAAHDVQLVLSGGTRQMDRTDDGWWQLTTDGGGGTRYAYSLDGGPPRPDPASRWLPDGVHDSAAVLDPSGWTWSRPRFQAAPITSAVIYELHIGTFTEEGTFRAAINHLPPLVELGVTHVEVMPVNAFDGRHGWGYDGVAWWAAHEPYGGPEGFAAFVDACHTAGLAVILDVVHNHLGPSGNYLPEFGPYLQADAESTWGKVINLDGPDSGPVRRFIIDSALAWLRDHQVDALRLDAVHALDDRGSATHLLAELADAVAALSEQQGRRLELIAETDRNDPQTVRPRAVGGLGLDAQWADDLHHAVHVAVTGETDGYYIDYADPLTALARAYTHGLVHDGTYSRFRDRVVGAPLPPDVSLRRLVVCAQNHDQVGNRPAGDRLTTLVEPNRVRVAAALVCLAPHTPMLFMGEEYGETDPFQFFSDMPGEELRAAIREGRRREFEYFDSWRGEIPDPLDESTLARSTLHRTLAAAPEGHQRRRLFTDLLALRRTEPALGTGDRRLVEATVDGRVLTVTRRPPPHAPAASVIVMVANLGTTPVDAPAGPRLLSTAASRYGGPDLGGDEGRVPPWTVAVHVPRPPAD